MNKEEAYEWFVKGFMVSGEGWNGGFPFRDEEEWRENKHFNSAFEEYWNEVDNND